jgi:hypothetical protein
MLAGLVVAASVVLASEQHPLRGPVSHPGAAAGRQQSGTETPAPAVAVREFQFRGLVFTIPASWSVERADRQPFRMEQITVTGRPAGPRLMFSEAVALVGDGLAPLGPRNTARGGNGVSFERFEMPNAMMRGVVYVFREAGVSVSAQVRTAADARAADAVAESARRALRPRAATPD